MSFIPMKEATIGRYIFRTLSSVTIRRSRKEIAATAEITLPAEYDGKYLCNEIKGGDEVVIALGYDDRKTEEFRGYVVDVAQRRPVVIQCEDETYRLKRMSPKARSWSSVKLKEIIAYVLPDAKTHDLPDVTLSPFQIKPGGSVFDVLEKLVKTYGLQAFFKDKTLHVTVPYYDMNDGTVRYDLERNVIRPDLTFRREGDVRIHVRAVSILRNNKKLTADVGDSDASAITTLHFYNVTTVAELKRLAEDRLKTMKYGGFSGTLLTFGVPYAEPGMAAEIRDRRFSGNRFGRYMIDAVTTTSGTGGFRREVEIGRALKKQNAQ